MNKTDAPLSVARRRVRFGLTWEQVGSRERAGNMFRGALGFALRRVCAPPLYERIFEPQQQDGPSGFRTLPRPFVLRPSVESVGTDVHIFSHDSEVIEAFERAFQSMGEDGIGRERVRSAVQIDSLPTTELDLLASDAPTESVTVRFLTATELKGMQDDELTFAVLFGRTVERVSLLARIYGTPLTTVDFADLKSRAGKVETVGQELRWHRTERRSTRTGQVHGIGGFTGTATFRGDLTRLVPWLDGAFWTGVGRHTSWGNGAIRCCVERSQFAG